MIPKWAILILAILAILAVLYFTGNKSVHQEITIYASQEKVWEVLTHTDKYPEWNPVMQLLEGEIQQGNNVTYRFTQDEVNSSEISATVEQMEPNKLLNHKGGIPFILTYDHQYILKSNHGSTTLVIHENYRGIGVNFWNPRAVDRAYALLIKAIKQRVESLN